MPEGNTFDEIWERILAHQGEIFQTPIRKCSLTYHVEGEKLIHTRCDTPLYRSNFNKAYLLLRQGKSLHNQVVGESYVKAILMDTRILG